MSFEELGLSSNVLRAVLEQGYDTPTPIQSKAIPIVLKGGDVMASAQTGTGKTAGFTLPLLQRLSTQSPPASQKRNAVRALILTPTRELAAQIAESVELYGQYLNISSAVVFGGVSINPQITKLRRGVDILIATPGRLLDHAGQGTVDLSSLEVLVLDEADRMLDMGFIHDVKRVLKLVPAKETRQSLLFSATFSPEIKRLAQSMLNQPELVEVAPNRLAEQLDKDGHTAAAIHGNKSQGARTRALAGFKDNNIKVLVATDIAARGLDIDQLPNVVNYELPNVPEDYVHRIGRTARAGMSGKAVSLVCIDEDKLLAGIERLINKRIPKVHLEGFEPDPSIPAEPIRNGGGGGGSRNKPRNASSQRRSQGQGNSGRNNGGNSRNGNGRAASRSSSEPSKRSSGRRQVTGT